MRKNNCEVCGKKTASQGTTGHILCRDHWRAWIKGQIELPAAR